MKKVNYVFLLVTLIVVLTFFISACKKSGEVIETKTVEYSKEEYELIMSSLKNEAILYYSKNYNETDFSDSFWDKKYKETEKTPKEYLNEITYEKIKENHAILSMAKKEKIIPDDNYEYICKSFKENTSQNKEGSSETSYGVTSFSLMEYYDYIISNCSVNLRNKIAENLTDEEIQNYYDENKDEMFLKPYIFDCEQVYIEGYSDSSNLQEKSEIILNAVKGGKDFKETVRREGLSLNEEQYDMSMIRSLSIRFPNIVEALDKMKQGDIKLVEENSNAYILFVVKKSPKEYLPLNDILENVKTYKALEKFNSEVKKEMELIDGTN